MCLVKFYAKNQEHENYHKCDEFASNATKSSSLNNQGLKAVAANIAQRLVCILVFASSILANNAVNNTNVKATVRYIVLSHALLTANEYEFLYYADFAESISIQKEDLRIVLLSVAKHMLKSDAAESANVAAKRLRLTLARKPDIAHRRVGLSSCVTGAAPP